MSATDMDRFLAKVTVAADGCWNWNASLTEGGYGQFFVRGKRWRSHRFSYTNHRGAIPDGLELDHLCRNRQCCNPEHLEAVSRRENQKRGTSPVSLNIDATQCVNGHAFNEANTRYIDDRRQCRACERDRKRRSREDAK